MTWEEIVTLRRESLLANVAGRVQWKFASLELNWNDASTASLTEIGVFTVRS